MLNICEPFPVEAFGWRDRVIAGYGGKVEVHLLHRNDINRFLKAHFLPMLETARLLAGRDVRSGLPSLGREGLPRDRGSTTCPMADAPSARTIPLDGARPRHARWSTRLATRRTPAGWLDACIMLWTALRIVHGQGVRIPKVAPVDERGLRMEMWA